MKIRIKPNAILQYILIYLLLIWHDSGIKMILGKTELDYAVLLICLFFILTKKKMQNKRMLLFCVLMASNIVLIRIACGGVGITTIFHNFSAIFLSYVVFLIDEENFVRRYVKTVVFFSVISIIIWIIVIINEDIYRNLTLFSYIPFERKLYTSNNIYVSEDVIYRGGLLYVLRNELTRNNGIFNEPGLYQIILNSALFFTMFHPKLVSENNKKSNYYLVILVITILSTQSTTGYLAFAVLLSGYLLTTKQKKALNVFRIVSLCFVLLVSDFILNGEESWVISTISNKLEFTSEGIEFIGTGAARVSTIEIVFSNIFRYPFGIGYDRVYELLNINGKTGADGAALVVDLLALGIQWWVLIYIFVIRSLFRNRHSIISFVVILFMYINTSLGQSDVLYPALLILIFNYQTIEKRVAC